ncbi:hypothetical protein BKA62DRAFT_718859 [Auriculariales sp. MPI-PUGE-AT-0066]|nr:hypothetical protein BKA62DRAFT_718859 [Auriculariales sp. MPI-PUGE-AT-0066]
MSSTIPKRAQMLADCRHPAEAHKAARNSKRNPTPSPPTPYNHTSSVTSSTGILADDRHDTVGLRVLDNEFTTLVDDAARLIPDALFNAVMNKPTVMTAFNHLKTIGRATETKYYAPLDYVLNSISAALYAAANKYRPTTHDRSHAWLFFVKQAIVWYRNHDSGIYNDYMLSHCKPDSTATTSTIEDLRQALTIARERCKSGSNDGVRATGGLVWAAHVSMGEVKSKHDPRLGQLKTYLHELCRYRPDLAVATGYSVQHTDSKQPQLLLARCNARGFWSSKQYDLEDKRAWIAYVVQVYHDLVTRLEFVKRAHSTVSNTLVLELELPEKDGDGELDSENEDGDTQEHDRSDGATKRIFISPFYAHAPPGRQTHVGFVLAEPSGNAPVLDDELDDAYFVDRSTKLVKFMRQDSRRRHEGRLYRHLSRRSLHPGIARVLSWVRLRYLGIHNCGDEVTSERAQESDAVIDVSVLGSIGKPLSEIPTLRMKLYVFADACIALIAMHRSGVLHRDLSSSNILWDPVHHESTMLDKTGRKINRIHSSISHILDGEDVDKFCCLITDFDMAAYCDEKTLVAKGLHAHERTGTPRFMPSEVSASMNNPLRWTRRVYPDMFNAALQRPSGVAEQVWDRARKELDADSDSSVEYQNLWNDNFINDVKASVADADRLMVNAHQARMSGNSEVNGEIVNLVDVDDNGWLWLRSPQPQSSRSDAESLFWVMVWDLVRCVPDIGCTDESESSAFQSVMSFMNASDPEGLAQKRGLRTENLDEAPHSSLRGVGKLLERIRTYIIDVPWHFLGSDRLHPLHVLVAMWRMILNFLADPANTQVLATQLRTREPRAYRVPHQKQYDTNSIAGSFKHHVHMFQPAPTPKLRAPKQLGQKAAMPDATTPRGNSKRARMKLNQPSRKSNKRTFPNLPAGPSSAADDENEDMMDVDKDGDQVSDADKLSDDEADDQSEEKEGDDGDEEDQEDEDAYAGEATSFKQPKLDDPTTRASSVGNRDDGAPQTPALMLPPPRKPLTYKNLTDEQRKSSRTPAVMAVLLSKGRLYDRGNAGVAQAVGSQSASREAGGGSQSASHEASQSATSQSLHFS